MNQAAVNLNHANISTGHAIAEPYQWITESALWEKHKHAYKLVQSFDSVDQFHQFFDHLQRVDKEFYNEFGGEILEQVLNGPSEAYVDSFDQRYFKLIQLYSNFDLSAALDFHFQAESIYKRSTTSLVRYDRIISSLKNATGILTTYQHQKEPSMQYPILPLSGGWGIQHYTMQQKSALAGVTHHNAVVHGKVALENPVARAISPVSNLGDCEVAESRWLSRPNTRAADGIGFFTLPNARISKAPTGVAFNINDEWQYLNALADVYHYFRVAGEAVFGQVSKRIERAYVLPRTGNSNYYCSLLNRLPAIFAYHHLGLDIPIVSSYQLSEIEIYFAKKMGIDIGKIEFDERSEIAIDTAIVPILADLKILFARYCMSLPKSSSPFGKRIYISRANTTDRPMANEAELEHLLSNYGFDVVAMEQFNLEEQMAIAGGADFIVAPHGAGLTNMIFSSQGTRIFELVPEYYMQSSFRQLAIECGHHYSMLLGKQAAADGGGEPMSWTVDLGRIKAVLDDVFNDSECVSK